MLLYNYTSFDASSALFSHLLCLSPGGEGRDRARRLFIHPHPTPLSNFQQVRRGLRGSGDKVECSPPPLQSFSFTSHQKSQATLAALKTSKHFQTYTLHHQIYTRQHILWWKQGKSGENGEHLLCHISVAPVGEEIRARRGLLQSVTLPNIHGAFEHCGQYFDRKLTDLAPCQKKNSSYQLKKGWEHGGNFCKQSVKF